MTKTERLALFTAHALQGVMSTEIDGDMLEPEGRASIAMASAIATELEFRNVCKYIDVSDSPISLDNIPDLTQEMEL